MSEQEKRQIMEALISEIQIYEERQPNGQWLKSIKFKLPIIEEDMSLSLDNDTQVETVVLMSRSSGWFLKNGKGWQPIRQLDYLGRLQAAE